MNFNAVSEISSDVIEAVDAIVRSIIAINSVIPIVCTCFPALRVGSNISQLIFLLYSQYTPWLKTHQIQLNRGSAPSSDTYVPPALRNKRSQSRSGMGKIVEESIKSVFSLVSTWAAADSGTSLPVIVRRIGLN